ncbi:MAG: DEAD/DEAH box helicase family protein [Acholeplasmataceae bacterium]|nr:DEAD/DEAH box helicase family protein [Acholeplasmataceae bacterium]
MDKFDLIMSKFREESTSLRDQGNKFEHFVIKYLKTDPLYSDFIDEAWLWSDWPYREKMNDTGIDIIVKEKNFNTFWAIQCKFYGAGTSISKSDLDTFLSASGKSFKIDEQSYFFTRRLIISTIDKWTKNAEDTIKNQMIPISRIGLSDFRNSSINWDKFDNDDLESLVLQEPKKLYPFQELAFKDVNEGFNKYDRGKLIMACGSGKTFTSLKIAENLMDGNSIILFLVPSISLLSQTIREWGAQIDKNTHFIAVCSDSKASNNEDISVNDVVMPASTDLLTVAKYYNAYKKTGGNIIFFSTYQSIDIVSLVQKNNSIIFDLIISDEAHRTTGVTLQGDNESYFVKVHNNNFIKSKKRLYMTATPRIYGDESKGKAEEKEAILASMDDEEIYGPTFHNLTFSQAVDQNILSDYKVLVLAVDEKFASRTLQRLITDHNSELKLDDAVKILGCWNGLSKKGKIDSELGMIDDSFGADPYPMKRAVAFSNRIADSKRISEQFLEVIKEYKKQIPDTELIDIEIDHVDGTFNSLERNKKLDWLKQEEIDEKCKILSNARCLSEGVDVPSLDAVLFLNPRNSIVDIIQSVGRVMRKAPGKKYGYIILPVGIPSDISPEDALKDNERYKIVWDVLQALRSHDDRFNNTINKINFNKRKPDQISIIGVTGGGEIETTTQTEMQFGPEFFQSWQNSIYAKIVEKVGSRVYWETWAKDIALIAQRHIDGINDLLNENNDKYSLAFDNFLNNLKININPSINRQEAIEMLAQHLITKPVFDALFEDYSFHKMNPVSVAMEKILSILNEKRFEKEHGVLEGFYNSVRKRASGIDNFEGKQKIILELYEKFFKVALPKQVEKLGIVYTPIQVVDFIIQSVEKTLNSHFNLSLSSKEVKILDPFTGTGTFIVRLIQTILKKHPNLEFKYNYDLHANEIVLLAYYIALINIEQAYHEGMDSDDYSQFPGMVLTDTFQMTENKSPINPYSKALVDQIMMENNERAIKQLQNDIQVIIGNPPYSIGQKNANDNNQNLGYPLLDKSIQDSYSKNSNAQQNKGLYDSYIKAFRWASDRITNKGVICFVSNGAFIDNAGMDGFRKCLFDEFSSIYIFNLRGNQRTSGELSRKEGGKIFGSGSRTPIAITLLVKNPDMQKDDFIHYFDIGDYLDREEKLRIIDEYQNITNIDWIKVYPDSFNDWINSRNEEFENYAIIGDKSKQESITYFIPRYATGLFTSRDSWIYNSSKKGLEKTISGFIDFYNAEIERCCKLVTKKDKDISRYKSEDLRKTNWSVNLTKKFIKKEKMVFDKNKIRTVMYRPFFKQFAYFERDLIERPSSWESIFPNDFTENYVICTSGIGSNKDYSVLIADTFVDLQLNFNGQCFPLYYYEPSNTLDLFGESFGGYSRVDGISDHILKNFNKNVDSKITKKDIFYYVYGVLHSKTYREKYTNDLKKSLARIPVLNDFWTFKNAGEELAKLHINYEKEDTCTEVTVELKKEEYTVERMQFEKTTDRSSIVYNKWITISSIPEKAYEYVINGKSAIEWVMERYQRIVDKKTEIVNNPNDYQDGKYVFELLLKIINVSLKHIKIIDSLPGIDII